MEKPRRSHVPVVCAAVATLALWIALPWAAYRSGYGSGEVRRTDGPSASPLFWFDDAHVGRLRVGDGASHGGSPSAEMVLFSRDGDRSSVTLADPVAGRGELVFGDAAASRDGVVYCLDPERCLLLGFRPAGEEAKSWAIRPAPGSHLVRASGSGDALLATALPGPLGFGLEGALRPDTLLQPLAWAISRAGLAIPSTAVDAVWLSTEELVVVGGLPLTAARLRRQADGTTALRGPDAMVERRELPGGEAKGDVVAAGFRDRDTVVLVLRRRGELPMTDILCWRWTSGEVEVVEAVPNVGAAVLSPNCRWMAYTGASVWGPGDAMQFVDVALARQPG